jgi:hypothetical protein
MTNEKLSLHAPAFALVRTLKTFGIVFMQLAVDAADARDFGLAHAVGAVEGWI